MVVKLLIVSSFLDVLLVCHDDPELARHVRGLITAPSVRHDAECRARVVAKSKGRR